MFGTGEDVTVSVRFVSSVVLLSSPMGEMESEVLDVIPLNNALSACLVGLVD